MHRRLEDKNTMHTNFPLDLLRLIPPIESSIASVLNVEPRDKITNCKHMYIVDNINFTQRQMFFFFFYRFFKTQMLNQ